MVKFFKRNKEQSETIAKHQKSIDRLFAEIAEIEKRVAEKDAHIAKLEAKINELEVALIAEGAKEAQSIFQEWFLGVDNDKKK